MIEIIIPGACVPKGRPRVTFQHGKAFAYTPQRTREYAQKAGWYAKGILLEQGREPIPLGTPVRMPVEFHRKGEPYKKPDVFNLLVQIADTLQGITYQDDCQVTEVHAYQVKGKYPMTRVVIEELTADGSANSKPDAKKGNAPRHQSGNKGNK